MKFIKRLFFTICILIILSCTGVLVCALNPEITEGIVAAMNGEKAGGKGSASQDNDGNNSGQNSQTVSPVNTNGNNNTAISNALNTGIISPYQIPDSRNIAVPDKVNGKSGYQPVQDKEQQIGDSDALSLEKELEKGDLGNGLSFDSAYYPYYAMLSSDMQTLYKQIYANAEDVKMSFAPAVSVNVSQLKTVFEALFGDHPELFWVETAYSCKYTRNGQVVEIDMNYYSIVNNLANAKTNFEGQAQNIVNEANQLSGDYEKEKYVHDALISKVVYDASAEMDQSAYSALVNGRSVCAGYARSFQYIMQKLGIPAYYCMGYSGEDHAWNIVKLSDGYYNVDVTWDDTNPSTYDYFNKSDADYSSTHMRTGLSVYLPACNGTEFSNREKGATQTVELPAEPAEATNAKKTVPLVWERPETVETVSGNDIVVKDCEALRKAGVKPEDVITTLDGYYKDCYHQLVSVGYGDRQFSNVVTDVEMFIIEQEYASGRYEKGYVTAALDKLGMNQFAIGLQVENLGEGFYRIYHNIVTWRN